MLINSLIHKQLDSVKPFSSIDSVEKKLLNDGFLVVEDNGTYIGLLTLSDIIKRPHNLVIDCLGPKPELHEKDNVFETLEVMLKENYFVLPVFSSENSEYLGIVRYSDILQEVYSLKSLPAEIKIENPIGDPDLEGLKHSFIHELYHNTKNPIQIIYSTLEMIKDISETRGIESLLDNILINTSKIDDIINRLYDDYFTIKPLSSTPGAASDPGVGNDAPD